MHADETYKLLFDASNSLGLKPKQESNYGLFSIEIDKTRQFLFYSTSPLNSELASYLANNKHSARLIFDTFKLPNIPYILPSNKKELNDFFIEHSKIIAKPTRGRQSKDVHLVSSKHQLDRLPFEDMIFEKFIEGIELRYLLLDNKVLSVHRRDFPGLIHNPSRVVRTALEKSEWDQSLIEISLHAMHAIGLKFCAVDFIVSKKQPYLLEINAAPGLYYFKYPHKGPAIDIGKIYLQAVATNINPEWKSPL